MTDQLQLELASTKTGAGYTWSFQPDWSPAIEHTRFTAVRQSLLRPDARLRTVLITPLWDQAGEPYVSGFRLVLLTDQGEAAHDFARSYFEYEARLLCLSVGTTNETGAEDSYSWRLIARLDGESWAISRAAGERAAAQLSKARDGNLSALVRTSLPEGRIHEEDLPVFVPRSVCEEIEAAARQAAPMETGGVLIGHMCRDAGSGELYAWVTAQVPALAAMGSESELRFTPDVWADVRSTIALRRREELWLAWNHSHPSSCVACAPEKQEACPLATALFSPQDRKLHRTVFFQAHQFALVANVLSHRVLFAMFGWREGRIRRRGFYICNGGGSEQKGE